MTGMPDEHGQRLMAWSAYPPGGTPKVATTIAEHGRGLQQACESAQERS